MNWGLTYTGIETNNFIEINRNNSTISNVHQDTTKILGTLVIFAVLVFVFLIKMIVGVINKGS